MIKADQAASSANERDSNTIMDDQDEDNIKNHPVISRLNQLNHLSDKLDSKVESKVKGLSEQIENLVKASTLMVSNDDDDDEDDEISDDDVEEAVQDGDSEMEDAIGADADDASTASSSEDEEEEAVMQKRLMNEARFALRKQDDAEEETDGKSSKRSRRRALPSFSDFGDDENADEAEITAAGKSLASTINRISQRSKSDKKSGIAPEANDEDDEERFKRGLAQMEAEVGGGKEDDDDDGEDDDEGILDEDDDGDDFYAQIKKKSEAKQEYKKSLYAVAPKYPGMDDEIEGERALGNMIMKNRGLVAHKNKINRNPRVKKREQYRKALIKRKGAVREVRTEEGHKYGGEDTGIKSGLSRSRKLL